MKAHQKNEVEEAFEEKFSSQVRRGMVKHPLPQFDEAELNPARCSISKASMDYNRYIVQQFKEVESMKRKTEHKDKQISGVDTNQQMRYISSQINEMQIILKTTIPEDDKHLVITETTPQQVKVFADTLLSYKVPCHRRPAPCQLKIKYFNQTPGVKPSLVVYQSFKALNPSEKNYEQKHVAPRKWLVEDPDEKPIFRDVYTIHLSFYSPEEVTIEVSCLFIDQKKQRAEMQEKFKNRKRRNEPLDEEESRLISAELLRGYRENYP